MSTMSNIDATGLKRADITQANRRRYLRIGVEGLGIDACLIPSQVPVTLLEMGPGGFSMQLSEECQAGDVYTVRISSELCPPIELTARVVHRLRAHLGTGESVYLAGLEFVKSRTPGLKKLLDRLAHVDRS